MLRAIESPIEGVLYILIFGVGSILRMMVISTVIGLLFGLLSGRFTSLNHTIRFLAGTLSVSLGVFVMIDIGLIKGLFYGTYWIGAPVINFSRLQFFIRLWSHPEPDGLQIWKCG